MRDAVCHERALAPRPGLRTPKYQPRKPAGAVGCGEEVRGGLECICGGLLGGFCGSLASSLCGGLASGLWGLVGVLCIGHLDMLLCSSGPAKRWCRVRLEEDMGKGNCN